MSDLQLRLKLQASIQKLRQDNAALQAQIARVTVQAMYDRIAMRRLIASIHPLGDEHVGVVYRDVMREVNERAKAGQADMTPKSDRARVLSAFAEGAPKGEG